MSRVVAILLAAGESARLGRPKQLLPFRGQTLLRHAARTALDSGCDEVFVVLGDSSERMRPELDGLAVRVVDNTRWASGMSSSIRTGLEAALLDSLPLEGALILLADQPLVTASHLARMLALFRSSEASIVAAHYEGHPGPPILFSAALFPQLLRLDGGKGARTLVASRRAETLLFELPEASVDIDVEADVRVLSEA
ncbi:MAG: nucleotidyltransferase family protein [Myxococcaceae bacterium]